MLKSVNPINSVPALNNNNNNNNNNNKTQMARIIQKAVLVPYLKLIKNNSFLKSYPLRKVISR